MRWTKPVLFVAILAAVFAAGLAVRREVLCAQYMAYGRPLPFDLESALYYRYAGMVFREGKLPEIDRAVQYPEGVSVSETYETGTEYINGFLARLFPGRMPFDERLRWISAAWFCMGIPALFLWLWWWQGSFCGATLGALYYALAIAGVIRSTGQEISHENFALPLLVAHWAASALSEKQREHAGFSVALSVLSALLLALALALWDLVQFYVFAWAALGLARALRGCYFSDWRRRLDWLFKLCTLVSAAAASPYLRAHGFVFSPPMLLAYGAAAAFLAGPKADPAAAAGRGRLIRAALRLGAALLPLAAGLWFAGHYIESYGHFAELLQAKMLFLNSKPSDPAALTFTQRILWVPALNSATFSLTMKLFPVTLLVFVLTASVLLVNPRWRSDPGTTDLLFFSFLSLTGFIFFVRFHVFTAICFAAAAGLLGAWAARRHNMFLRVTIIIALLGGAVAEGAHTLRNPVRWGSGQAYLEQRKELARWLASNAPGQPVLANFGVSAFVLAYAGNPIVLHPKFESPEIRSRVRGYCETLFRENEERFRAWADRYGAAFYVYSMGEFAPVHPEAQNRYFAGALNPPPDAAARLFEFRPRAARWFTLLWENGKYRVFRVITRADERTARARLASARRNMLSGSLGAAELDAQHALLYDPNSKEAAGALLEIDALKKRKLPAGRQAR